MTNPTVIAVIGHRDAIITDAIKQQISDFFEELWQESSQKSIILLSPLAIGADTVVAEIFLAQKEQTGRDYRLHVPLPMAIEDYKTTFSEADFLYFQSLCGKADKVFVLPTNENQSKPEQFRQGARYLIENSQQTIVLWDGDTGGAMGGTADSVFYLQHGYYAGESHCFPAIDKGWQSPFMIISQRNNKIF